MSSADATPTFSWSYSRDRTLEACDRRYFYQYYAAHGGWRTDAPADSRLAFELKQLVTLDMVLGTELHARAREMALAIRSHREPPSAAVLRERTRQALNHAYRDSRVATYHRTTVSPSRMLREIYYGGRIEPEKITRIQEKMERCLTTLSDSSVWADLRCCSPSEIRVVEALSTFRLAGVNVYAAPDLLYRFNCEWTLVEWKTGASDDVARQLALYAIFAQKILRLIEDPRELVAKVVLLSEGRDEIISLSTEDLERALEWVSVSVGRMRRLLVDSDSNVPMPRESFAMTTRWSLCQRCNFLRCCAAELGLGRDSSGPSDTQPEER